MAEKVFGVIAARGGSKGLPGKNLRPLGGIPLIGWTIRAAQQSRELTRTWVSTEDAQIAKAARELGAEVPFLRPAELAQDDSSIFVVLQHAVKELAEREGEAPDVVVLLQPTSPLRTAHYIDKTVRLLLDTGADSAQTVTLDCTHPRHRFTLDGDKLAPFLADEEKSSRRQDGAPVYRPNGGVYAARAKVLMEKGGLRGEDHRGVVMDFESSVDIDSLWDFKMAEFILESRKVKAN